MTKKAPNTTPGQKKKSKKAAGKTGSSNGNAKKTTKNAVVPVTESPTVSKPKSNAQAPSSTKPPSAIVLAKEEAEAQVMEPVELTEITDAEDAILEDDLQDEISTTETSSSSQPAVPKPKPPPPFEVDAQSVKAEEHIMVVVRVRPLNAKEIDMRSPECIGFPEKHEISIHKEDIRSEGIQQHDIKKQFTFDRVFPQKSTQEQIYLETGLRILKKVVIGYNGCLFAYGQTGSGKTFTMEGSREQPGVMKRMTKDLFTYFESKSDLIEYELKASYLEIYQDKIVDLLAQVQGLSDETELNIREDTTRGIVVTNLVEIPVNSYEDVEKLLHNGSKFRKRGETKMNAVSSRSHAIFTIFLDQKEKGDEDGVTLSQSKIHLIDLAGSERAGATGAVGIRLKEGAKINQSLSALGNCINALVQQKPFIPYRNSKLTRLLQDSLGGNSITMIIANLSPALVNFEESLSTLQFADRAKQIKNKIRLARDPKSLRIKELTEENKKLKKTIAELQAKIEIFERNNKLPPPKVIIPRDNYAQTDAAKAKCCACCTIM